MKQYIINAETLFLAKKIIDKYTCHDLHCSYNMVEVCDCGLSNLIRKYIKQVSNLTEYTEEKDSL